MRNPANMTAIPINKVTANAVMAPKTELKVPLPDRMSVPAAMAAFDHNTRRGAPVRTTRQPLQPAPTKMTSAPPADPVAASTRGSGPNTFEP
jgi:hypothetical protein